MTMNKLSIQGLGGLQAATMAARKRTGQKIGVAVERGRFRAVRIEGDGAAGEIPLSDFDTLPNTIAFLNNL